MKKAGKSGDNGWHSMPSRQRTGHQLRTTNAIKLVFMTV